MNEIVHIARPSALISASSDWEAIVSWLGRIQNKNTFNAYLKEVDRFHQWFSSNRKTLSTLTHEDFLLYEAFLKNPPKEWVGKRVSRSHPEWAPLSGPLSGASIRQAMIVLDGLMSWLVQAKYIQANPLSLQTVRRGGKRRLSRFLSQGELSEILAAIDGIENKDFYFFRKRWLFCLLSMSGLRISEVCSLKMSDFFKSKRDDSWWIRVIGKGDKERLVPLSTQLLFLYQQFKDLLVSYERWSSIEDMPALPSSKSSSFVNRRTAHSILKDLFKEVEDRLKEETALSLRNVSAHWLRHSYGTMLADNNIDVRVIKENLGHSSIQSTQIYLHVDENLRYRQSKDIEL